MSVHGNIDSGSWIKDEIIDKLKETIRKQATMIMEQRTQITDLEDSLSQAEVLQNLMRRSKEQVLTVMAQETRSKGCQTLTTKIHSTASQALPKTKEKGTDTGTHAINKMVATQTRKLKTRWVGTQTGEDADNDWESEYNAALAVFYEDTDDGF